MIVVINTENVWNVDAKIVFGESVDLLLLVSNNCVCEVARITLNF